MYPSKGGGGYGGQQPYAAQQSYGQHTGTGFSGNPATGPDMGAQHALASRQASMMGIAQEADATGYRTHSTQAAQYGGPYASVYGSTALSNGQQVGGASSKGTVASTLQGRTAYPSSLAESSKFSSGALGSGFSDDYLSSSNRGYAQRGDQYSGAKSSEYAIDRRPYGEHQGGYVGRDPQSDPARRYADSASLSHQTDVHDHMDQASLIRQQQIIKAQSLHSGPDIRQAEYLAARAAPIHHGSQDFSSYGGRMDVDSHGLPILGSSQYGAQHSTSILGAPRRNVDDLIYAQGSSNAGFGVSLPPGRDYMSGKALHGPTGSDYQGSIISRDHLNLGAPTIAERKDDRDAFRRELDLRDEERRRDMMREREKERDRERERERDRERERERMLDRRDRERERDLRRGLDSRRERTPPRASKDRRGSSALRDERPRRTSPRRTPARRLSPRRVSPRRVSPRREAVNRHRSPVKEKKREYVCKVHPIGLVEAERDYLSINKRYPRLSISPEFTKVVLKWPKENLHLSLHTPVSFEHDFIEDSKNEETGLSPRVESSKITNIVWNAKVILMSGVSGDTLGELCSDRSSDDRLIHFNNFLRFAILKKDHSLMAIGGQWKETVDGVEPSIDDSSLIQTARRCVKDITQLDLQNCQHWNPFLEIHYNRIGDDGLSSYKEVTILFVPDLLDCLPTLDSWRSKWLAHKKEIVEREKRLSSKKEKKSSEKESLQDDHGHSKPKKAATSKISKVDDRPSKDEKICKVEKTKEDGGDSKIGTEQKKNLPEPAENPTEKHDLAMVGDDKTHNKKALNPVSTDPKVEVKKPGKKKIIRKVVKGKATDKQATLAIDNQASLVSVDKQATLSEVKGKATDKQATLATDNQASLVTGETVAKHATLATDKQASLVTDETVAKHDVKMNEKDVENKQTGQESSVVHIHDSSAEPEKAKTFIRKKVIRKVSAGKSSPEEGKNVAEKKTEQEMKNQGEKESADKQLTVDANQQTPETKAVGKKRIIRRVIKKKVLPAKNGEQVESNSSGQKAIQEEELPSINEEQDLAKSSLSENKITETKNSVIEKDGAVEKKTNAAKDDKKVTRIDDKVSKTEKRGLPNSELGTPKDKDSEKDVRNAKGQEKDKRSKDAKHDSRPKSSKEVKEKGKSDEPPKNPGLFLQTKRTKGLKIRSLSLSLAGLLEYNDKDIEESTFELSLFAESFNEMLQYQMGCRILSFLEKLRKRFVIKHKQRKRQREEKNEKESEAEAKKGKRPKINKDKDISQTEKEPLKPETQDTADVNRDENDSKDKDAAEADKSDPEKRSDVDESCEEDEEQEDMYEEYEEVEEVVMGSDAIPEDMVDETVVEEVETQVKSELPAKDDKGKESAGEKSTKETEKKDDLLKEEVVDKELHQAFRFFDYNKVGYIKMDDLRCLLHNLGQFLSHRDVKELVQSALYESSSARDDRIFYKKLVRIRDL